MYVKKQKENKQLANVTVTDFNLSKWIDTPFSFTHAFMGRSIDRKDGSQITSGLTLVQQQVMLIVSSKFKKNVEEYYRMMRGKEKGKEPYLPLFTEDSVREDLNGFYDIPLSEIVTTFKGFNIQRDVVEQLKKLSLYVPSSDLDSYYDVVIFSTFRVSPAKKTLEVKLNPDIVKYLLNMNEGYIHHLKAIAEASSKKYTPLFYFYVLHLLRDKDKVTVVRPLDELREYLGLVSYKDGTRIIENRKYPAYSDFRLKVIEPCQKELSELAKKFLADVTFKVVPVYDKPGKTRGNPENLQYTIERNLYGKLANDVRGGRKDVARAIEILQGSIISNDAPKARQKEKIPQIKRGEGLELWQSFLSLVIEPSQKSLLSRMRFVGMKNNRFCVECSDDDFKMLESSDAVIKLAKEFFKCPRSHAPVFYRS